MNIKGIIFDFGFTLYYFEDVSIDKYFECFRRGMKKSIEYLKNLKIFEQDDKKIYEFQNIFKKKRAHFFRKSIRNKEEYPTSFIFQTVLELMSKKKLINNIAEIDKEKLTEIATLYHSFEEKEWIPFKETETTLEKISDKGIKMAVLSNHPHHPTIKNILKKHNLLKFFNTVVTSAKFGKRKPNPEIFNHTLERIGLVEKAHLCLMCGDEHADIAGGYKAGLQTILFERKYKFPFEKEINFSNLIKVRNISEILDYIE